MDTGLMFIGGGATRAQEVACHGIEVWERLLAAMDAGDHTAIARLASEPATVLPIKALRPLPPRNLADYARDFWQRRQARGGR